MEANQQEYPRTRSEILRDQFFGINTAQKKQESTLTDQKGYLSFFYFKFLNLNFFFTKKVITEIVSPMVKCEPVSQPVLRSFRKFEPEKQIEKTVENKSKSLLRSIFFLKIDNFYFKY